MALQALRTRGAVRAGSGGRPPLERRCQITERIGEHCWRSVHGAGLIRRPILSRLARPELICHDGSDDHLRPQRPAQRRDHRPCRPRQDHARGRDAAPDRHVPQQRGGRRSRARLRRPRAREGDHDPRQADDGRLRRRPPEHRRHAGPRRLRRRGRALTAAGRRRAAAGGRGRGAAPADPLRPPEGDGPPPPGDRGPQQDRPIRRTPDRGARRGLRPVHRPRRR